MGFWKTFLACLLAIVVSSILSVIFSFIVLFGMIAALTSFEGDTYKVAKNSVLVLDLGADIVETSGASSNSPMEVFDLLSGKFADKITTYNAVKLIESAAIDPNIKGIYIKVPLEMSVSANALYELRTALQNFKESTSGSKFIISYGDYYSQGAIYLSSVADKVYLNSAGMVNWSGMAASVMFYKGTMDKLGIEPEIIRHGTFKGAVEPFMLDKMSDANRLQYEDMLGSIWGYFVGQVASSRSLDSASLQAAATELAATTASGALKIGVVDSLFYMDELIADLKVRTGDKEPKMMTLSEYKRSGAGVTYPTGQRVALIYADGDIVDQGDNSGFSGGSSIVGNNLAGIIRSAREDEKVKAIVLRVNSPGGSVVASDIIYREVYLARQQKPVVISMGNYAASGGYWISAPADAIVASPMTITGSIGVFGLMFNVEKGAREKLGITMDVVKTNPSADMGNMFRGLSPYERQIRQNGVDSIYNQFVALVASGRNMSFADVDSIASGRVWSGLQGLNNGLVDQCGTLSDAIALAAQKAGVEGDYSVKTYTKTPSTIFEIFSNSMQNAAAKVFGSVKSEAMIQAEKVEKILRLQGVQAVVPYKIEIDK